MLCFAFAQDTFAQEDSTSAMTDSIRTLSQNNAFFKADAAPVEQDVADTSMVKLKKVFVPNPKKAGMYASILPGSGQFYNRQYWKLPLVYAILGTAGYFIKYNYDKYTLYKKAYISRLDATTENDQFPLYTVADIKRLQDSYRKDLDVIVLLTAVGYAAQILDAVASAHLKNFDISPDISMRMQPVLQDNYAGVGLVFNFK